LSIGIVLEPATPPALAPNQFLIQDLYHPDSYAEKTVDGYNLYIKGRFIGKADYISDDFKDLKILERV